MGRSGTVLLQPNTLRNEAFHIISFEAFCSSMQLNAFNCLVTFCQTEKNKQKASLVKLLTSPCPTPRDKSPIICFHLSFHTDDAVSTFWRDARIGLDHFLMLSIGHHVKFDALVLKILTSPWLCENPCWWECLCSCCSVMRVLLLLLQWDPRPPRPCRCAQTSSPASWARTASGGSTIGSDAGHARPGSMITRIRTPQYAEICTPTTCAGRGSWTRIPRPAKPSGCSELVQRVEAAVNGTGLLGCSAQWLVWMEVQKLLDLLAKEHCSQERISLWWCRTLTSSTLLNVFLQ